MLKKRIKLLCALLAAAGILTSAGTPAAANGGEPSVSAKAAVLMTADNSTVLYEKAAEEKLPMASTTKNYDGASDLGSGSGRGPSGEDHR